jgi:hypothetical protein
MERGDPERIVRAGSGAACPLSDPKQVTRRNRAGRENTAADRELSADCAYVT